MKHLFVAGFDFGTSYSKVVLRDQLTGETKVVTFGPECVGLLPSHLVVHNDNLYGPLDGVVGDIISYPKLIAADIAEGGDRFKTIYSGRFKGFQERVGINNPKDAADVMLIRYFFTIIRGIRDFIGRDRDWSDSDAKLDPLMVQLAVPSGLMAERDGPLEEMMVKALRAAHYLAHQQSDAPVLADLLRVKGELKGMSRQALEVLDKCCVIYPEVAAGVQAILRSRGTPNGKYITMDVGAGTVDLNAFYRHSSGLDYWSCEVVPLGFARLKIDDPILPGDNNDATFDPLSESVLMSELRQAVSALMKQAFRYLNQIQNLLRRPELRANLDLIGEGNTAILQNERLLGGVVNVVPGSAVLTDHGCRAIVSLRTNQHTEADLFHADAVSIAQLINKPAGLRVIPFGCAGRKDVNGRFHLHVNRMPDQFECHR